MGYYYLDDKGEVQYGQNDWEQFWNWLTGGESEDSSRWRLEFNAALAQYNQQYQLQKEAFDLNKQNQQFNQQLASDQFNMQKEAYYNGVLNQANQLRQLGINPASQGQISSGPSMSGGSNVGDISAGSVPGRNPSVQVASKDMMKLQLLSTMMQYVMQKKQASIAQQDANTRSYSAHTERMRAISQGKVDEANIEHIDLVNEAQTYQNMDLKRFNDSFGALGISSKASEFMKNVDPLVFAACGIVSILGNSKPGESDGAEAQVAVDNAHAIVNLPRSKQNAIEDWFEQHPSVSVDNMAYMMSGLLKDIKEDPKYYTYDVIQSSLDSIFGGY